MFTGARGAASSEARSGRRERQGATHKPTYKPTWFSPFSSA